MSAVNQWANSTAQWQVEDLPKRARVDHNKRRVRGYNSGLGLRPQQGTEADVDQGGLTESFLSIIIQKMGQKLTI